MGDLRDIITTLATLEKELSRLLEDSSPISVLRPPASEEDIARLIQRYRIDLPKDYVAFLRLHDGWQDYAFCGTFMGTVDHGASWAEEQIKLRRMHFDEKGIPLPLDAGAVPLVLSEVHDDFLIFDPVGAEDGKNIVEYRYADIIHTYETFIDYLKTVQTRMRNLTQYQLNGY